MNPKTLACCVLLATISIFGHARSDPVLLKGVSLEIVPPSQEGSLLHWRIRNRLEMAVYVYDFYLWGPAYHVSATPDKTIIETTPLTEIRSCPPYRFPPVLLLLVGPGRTIEGDFTDPEVRIVSGKPVSLQIAGRGEGRDVAVVERGRLLWRGHTRRLPGDGNMGKRL